MNNIITENEYGILDETHGAHNNTISKNTITGNRNFGIRSDGNNIITSNTIANNGGEDGGGIRAGGGDEIKFNPIYGNHRWGVYNDSGVAVNGSNNWWGANDGPSTTGSGDKVSASVKYDPWLVINISASHASIINGGATSIITADMTKNSNKRSTGPPHIPDGTQITFTVDRGSIGCLSVDKTTTNGKATATLTSSNALVLAMVCAKAPGHRAQSKVCTTVNFVASSSQITSALSKSPQLARRLMTLPARLSLK